MLLLADLAGQVKTWQEIFGGGPLAAFLGLMIAFLAAVAALYYRANRALLEEKDSHAETIRTTTQLAGAMERTWSEQLRVTSGATEQQERNTDLQNRSLAVLERSVALLERSRP